MKIDLTTIHKIGLSPNGIFVLFLMKRGLDPILVDADREISILVDNGFLTDSRELTKQGEEVLATAQYLCKSRSSREKLAENDIPYIEKYRSFWPTGKLPSGASARSSVNELKGRFETFFAKYPEYKDWNLILQAAAFYIDDAEQRSFEFTQNSENFIYREDKYRNMTSSLGKYCQMIIDGNVEEAQHAVPSIINIPGLQ